ncbi:hypothetical protein HOY82DRAFT_382825 [Tuber indicum]|nr:hypothetical protein HOY82DRAFT_382825 [Tuber indicum]
MQDLYHELWGRELPITQEFIAQVPQADYGIRPGYKMSMRPSATGTFSLPQFMAKRKQQSFKLIEVGGNLPCGVKKLLIRPEYEKIRQRLIRAEEARWDGVGQRSVNPRVSARLDYDVSGQPGTGKTFFLSYLLVRRLQKRQPTVYRADDKSCFLFDEDTPGHEISSKSLSRLPPQKKRKLWVLTDETIQNPRWHMPTSGWFVVLAASPEKVKASRQWQKERNPDVYFMSPWEWPEIFAAYSLGLAEPPHDDQIKKLFTTFACLGPVARTCLKAIDVRSDESYNKSLDIYLSQVDREIEAFIAHGGRETIEHTVHQDSSHRMAIMQPTKTGLSYKARIITRWMAYRVYDMALKRSQQDCFLLYQHLSRQPGLRSAAGSFFEGYVHDWFRLGGTFTAEEISNGGDSTHPFEFKTVKSKSCTPNYFMTADDLAGQVRNTGGKGLDLAATEKYFIPFSRNYEAVDGIIFSDLRTLVLFQMTLAKQHNIKSHGIKALLKVLPKTIKRVQVVFVVPESRQGDYSRTQNTPDAAAISPPGSHLEVKQSCLVFGDEDMQSVAVQGPFEMQEEDEEEDTDSGWC